jgi:hypothetical protein
MRSFMATLLVFLFVAQLPSPKEWKGLSALKSTRADVERLMGPPGNNIENKLLTYYLPDTVVDFQFSGNPRCGQKFPYPTWDVSEETVTVIKVSFKKQLLVADTGIDLTKFQKRKGNFDLPGHFYYSDTEDGFSIEVGNGYLMSYIYEPSGKSKNLQCESHEDGPRLSMVLGLKNVNGIATASDSSLRHHPTSAWSGLASSGPLW